MLSTHQLHQNPRRFPSPTELVSKAGSEILHDEHTSQGIHAVYTLVCQNLWPNYPTGYETLR